MATQARASDGVIHSSISLEVVSLRATTNLQVVRALLEFGADANAADALFNQNDRGRSAGSTGNVDNGVCEKEIPPGK